MVSILQEMRKRKKLKVDSGLPNSKFGKDSSIKDIHEICLNPFKTYIFEENDKPLRNGWVRIKGLPLQNKTPRINPLGAKIIDPDKTWVRASIALGPWLANLEASKQKTKDDQAARKSQAAANAQAREERAAERARRKR